MLSSGIIDLAIGMAFIFGATAGLASVITELVARFFGLRGAYLLLGLRELLDSSATPVALRDADDDFAKLRTIINDKAPDPPATRVARPAATAPAAQYEDKDKPTSATSALLGSPILRSQGMTGQIATRPLTLKAARSDRGKAPLPTGGLRSRRSLPSYIPARSFAAAVIDLVIPDKSGQTNMKVIQHYVGQLPDSMGTLKTSLQSLATNAGDDVTRFRTSVEQWYDDHMSRVSGWYKRRAAWITLAAGAILVLLLNINTITIGRALYSDSAARTAVSSLAAKSAPCPSSQDPNDRAQQNCLENLEHQVSGAAQAGLPLGWGIVPACATPRATCGWMEQHGITTPGDGSPWQVILALIGFLVTIVALTPGAQFWFGLVVKLNSLRSSGPPPASSAS